MRPLATAFFRAAILGSTALLLASTLSCDDDPTPAVRGLEVEGPFGEGVSVSSQESILGLTDRVDVVRDKYGMTHIYARNAEDAFRAQGYSIAKDRAVQLEILRRLATGTLGELSGDLAQDVSFRVAGLYRAGQKMYEQLDANGESKAWIDAYADGVTQWFAKLKNGEVSLPDGYLGFKTDLFHELTGAEIFAIARLQAYNLSYTADDEIAATDFMTRAHDTFRADAMDAAKAKRTGMLVDMYRFAPIENTLVMDGFPNDPGATLLANAVKAPNVGAVTPPQPTMRLSPAIMKQVGGFLQGSARARKFLGEKQYTGSNNWVVGPSRTETRHAMLASDPHLLLSAPSVFWMTHMSITGATPEEAIDFAGIAFPGIPAVILGFNKYVAWGATTADYDVTDVYRETLAPGGAGVVFEGKTVPFETSHEVIDVMGQKVEYDQQYVPHHGPIVPTVTGSSVTFPTTGEVLSIKWTGHEATSDIAAVFGIVRAKSVDEFRDAMRDFQVGAQNWVVADVEGNIFYTSHCQIPKRDARALAWNAAAFTGTMPHFVLPGEGTAEWKGYIEEAFVPHVKNPTAGFIGTANGDQVGVTLDNDPTNDRLPNGENGYVAAIHDPGFRVARVHERIQSVGRPITLDDMASIQADKRSNVGRKLAPLLVEALTRAEQEKRTPGTHPDLSALVTSMRWEPTTIANVKDALVKWGAEHDYDASAGVDLDTNLPTADASDALASRATLLFNAWLVRMISATFDDELKAMSSDGSAVDPPYSMQRALMNLMLPDRTTLKSYDATYGDSIVFDDMTTPALESRDQRIVLSMLDAIDLVKTRRGTDQNGWRWGLEHTLRFNALVSIWGPKLSIPTTGDTTFPKGFPRGGDGFNIDVAGYGARPPSYDQVNFAYSHGPTQRFVIDLDPAGPVARNALPGGNVWDSESPYFKNDADLWRKNENRRVNFAKDQIVEDAKERIQYSAPADAE